MEHFHNLGLDFRGMPANTKTPADSQINLHIDDQGYLIRVPRPLNVGEKTVFSTNGVRESGYPHGKEWSWTLTICYI